MFDEAGDDARVAVVGDESGLDCSTTGLLEPGDLLYVVFSFRWVADPPAYLDRGLGNWTGGGTIERLLYVIGEFASNRDLNAGRCKTDP